MKVNVYYIDKSEQEFENVKHIYHYASFMELVHGDDSVTGINTATVDQYATEKDDE